MSCIAASIPIRDRLSRARAGDVLGTRPVLGGGHLAEPLYTVHILSESKEQLAEFARAMLELSQEDSTLNALWLPELRELHIRLCGMVQSEVLSALLHTRYGLNATFTRPTVIYKEAVAKAGTGFVAYMMPKPCWAVVKLDFTPLSRGSGVVFEKPSPHATWRRVTGAMWSSAFRNRSRRSCTDEKSPIRA